MYDEVAKLHIIMNRVEVKEGSSWTLIFEIDQTLHVRFGNSLDNDGDLLAKLMTLFKTFNNVYRRSFDMMGKPRTFDFLVATTINHKHWVLLQRRCIFHPWIPLVDSWYLEPGRNKRIFAKKKPLEQRSQFLRIETWTKNFFLEKKD
jgi:hypothetical protein